MSHTKIFSYKLDHTSFFKRLESYFPSIFHLPSSSLPSLLPPPSSSPLSSPPSSLLPPPSLLLPPLSSLLPPSPPSFSSLLLLPPSPPSLLLSSLPQAISMLSLTRTPVGREMFGVHAYVIFTIDRLMQNIVRQVEASLSLSLPPSPPSR